MNEEASNSSTINSTQSLDETLHEYMKMNRGFFSSTLSIPRKKPGKTDKSPLSASSKTAATEDGFISDHIREVFIDDTLQEQAPSRLIETVEEESLDKIYDLGAPIVSSNNKKRPKSRRCVSFSEAKIVYFPMELGDNPSCRNGLPIQLGQEAIDMECIDVDLYEQVKNSSGHTRSHHDEMRMSFMQRRLILKRQHTNQELDARLKEMNKERKRQRRALRLYKFRLRILEFLSCRFK
ncbi:hypothetical protein CTEN210_04246 [Chaetoceros tenuissimus]|uniref:Uncharacterized protein n=1 Tax=Chaetoceros tenuissimus TaxID=426638 RepID=A0AAD3CKU0_9STRA|nr:hypothetical protein CTEN210_04246 [Chaetoceros tenuissimus]